jgi:hypothetical protein
MIEDMISERILPDGSRSIGKLPFNTNNKAHLEEGWKYISYRNPHARFFNHARENYHYTASSTDMDPAKDCLSF